MSESGLSMGYPDFCAAVGEFLGYTSSSSNWTSAQTTQIDKVVQDGVRQFYYPPSVEGIEEGYDWSFLRPTGSIDTTASTATVDLPDDFSRVLGDFYFQPDVSTSSVPIVSLGFLLGSQQSTDEEGTPKIAALRAKDSSGTTGQRWEAVFFPTPDAVYSLAYQYEAYSGKLSNSAPYPLGGMKFGQVLEESCLAVAERKINDEYGVHWKTFVALLRSAIARDKKTGASYFGAMGESSEFGSKIIPGRFVGASYPITYKGETW